MFTFDKNFELALPAALFGKDPSICYHPFAGLTGGSLLWLVTGLLESSDQDESDPRVYMFVHLEDALELVSARGNDYHELSLLDYTNIGKGRPAFLENIRSLWSFDVESNGEAHESGVKIITGDGTVHIARTRFRSHGRMIAKIIWRRPLLF